MEKLITLKEAADQLNVQKITLLRAIDAGRLQAIKLGRSYQFTQAMLDAYVESLMVNTVKAVNSAYGNN